METSINLTNYYWDLLKSLSDDVKLRLATRLTASVLEHRKDEATTNLTEEMLAKHAGKWIDDRSAEESHSQTAKAMTDEARFLIDSLVEQLTLMAVEEYKLSVPQALQLVYNSQLYEKITDLETGLYYQSAKYNYELLRHEMKYGKIA